MAFGKKNKKKAKNEQPQQTVKKVKVDMSHNPLYPPKKESDAKELLTAFGTTAVSLLLVGVIVSNFSYASRAGASRNNGKNQQAAVQNQQDVYGGNADGAGVNGADADHAGVNGGNVNDEHVNNENENGGNINGGETYAEGIQDDQAGQNEGNGEGFETAQGSAMDESTYEEPGAGREYIIDDSDSRYLYVEDLDELSAEELFYARNEIYARCGRLFSDEGLQAYFDSKEWYHGTIPPEEFTEDMLNDYERVNAVFIREYEAEKGYQ